MIGRRGILTGLLAAAAMPARAQGSDPLPSWRAGPRRQALLDFVAAVTTAGGPDFVPPEARVATFDNDGTLWVEQPIYTQALFILDRVRALAPSHPDWRTKEPFRSVLANDMRGVLAGGEKELAALVAATHGGMSEEAFRQEATAWLDTARDRRFGRKFTELVYRPMLDVLSFLRANGFRTFIVSGGGAEFVRCFSEQAYGIPVWQVVGSVGKARFALRDGGAAVMRTGEVAFIDDGPGKPVGIARAIGQRPIAAFGNSDGDLEMLQYATMAPGRRFGMIVHHDDPVREYAYDRDSRVGRLARALDAAPARSWQVASMKDDWSRVFAFDRPG